MDRAGRLYSWFHETYGSPTEIQTRVWAEAGSGHYLAMAPTGTGKTMAVFLPLLDELLDAGEAAGVRILYVSPLKALNTDMSRNLIAPLARLRDWRSARGLPDTALRIAVRTGDSTPAERKAVLKSPPAILATTPESLALLLLAQEASGLFQGLRAVILDEIHVLVGNKRGALLCTLLEILEQRHPGFRRIGVSATLADPVLAAACLGGFAAPGQPRPVRVIRVESEARVLPLIRWPEGTADPLSRLMPEFRQIIAESRSVVFFVNSRRMAERLARSINDEMGPKTAWAHHGSLSRELRFAVEDGLKSGKIRVVVATATLELGIDIGMLDDVVLVGTPPALSSVIQRGGRAGHRPGARGVVRLYPLHPRDACNALAMQQLLESTSAGTSTSCLEPLDVLAQAVLLAAAARAWTIEELHALICRAWHFSSLKIDRFMTVLEMLCGRLGERRVQALPLRAEIAGGKFRTLGGSVFLLRTAGGTIPPRGGIPLREAVTGAPLGEIDEEFAWERRIGDVFRMGNRVWRLERIDDHGAHVVQSAGDGALIPFWRAETPDSEDDTLARVRMLFDRARDPGALAAFPEDPVWRVVQEWIGQHLLDGRLLLPGTDTLILQDLAEQSGGDCSLLLVTSRGGRINRSLAWGLSSWCRTRFGIEGKTWWDDDCLVIAGLPGQIGGVSLFMEFAAACDETGIRKGLAGSHLFGSRFRDVAARSLVLPREMPGRFRPFWKFRERARQLLQRLAGERGLPVCEEAFRECERELLDIPGTLALLDGVLAGKIRVVPAPVDAALPITRGVRWNEANEQVYASDAPGTVPDIPLSDPDEDAVRSVFAWRAGLQPERAPGSRQELEEWLRMRILVPADEWKACCRLAGLVDNREADWVSAPDQEGVIRSVGTGSEMASGHLAQWLYYRGPYLPRDIARIFGATEACIAGLLDDLLEGGQIRRLSDGRVIEASGHDQALSLARRQRRQRAAVTVRPLHELAMFVAAVQGLGQPGRGVDGLARAVDRIFGWPAPAQVWDSDILPLRVEGYRPELLEGLFMEGDLLWTGRGKGKIIILPALDPACWLDDTPVVPGEQPVLPDEGLRFDEMVSLRGQSSMETALALWQSLWAGAVMGNDWRDLRAGMANKFSALRGTPLEANRKSWLAWRKARPDCGRWFPVHAQQPEGGDLLERQALLRRRIESVLHRSGILTRDIAAASGILPSWPEVYRELVRMEYDGSVLAGRFFDSLSGTQFVDSSAYPILLSLETAGHFSGLVSSYDPVFPLNGVLPEGVRRSPETRLVMAGGTIGAVLGRERLTACTPDPGLCCVMGEILAERVRQQSRSLRIEVIDGPGREALLDALLARGGRRCARGIELVWSGTG